MASIGEAFQAKDTILFAVQNLGSIAAAIKQRLEADSRQSTRLTPAQLLPRAESLQSAFDTLESDEKTNHPEVSPVRRGTLYGIVRAGFASGTLRPRLVPL